MSVVKTINLLYALNEMQTLLATIELMESRSDGASADPADAFTKMITLSYDSLKLKLFIDKKLPKQEGHSSLLYLQITFGINENELVHTGLYCERREHEGAISQLIRQSTPPSGFLWNTEKKDATYNETVIRYLALADDIARQAQHCSSGDDYRPGYYSEIVLEDTRIHLKQINHWNARSIDHGEDYFMRSLEFDIPLQPVTTRSSSFLSDNIGDMQIYFFDRSSDNNRECGKKIQEQIRIAKKEFAESPS